MLLSVQQESAHKDLGRAMWKSAWEGWHSVGSVFTEIAHIDCYYVIKDSLSLFFFLLQ